TLAPRPASLRGLTLGLLENTKPNARLLLASVGRELRREHAVQAVLMYTKSYFGTPTEESLIQRILHSCDFVVAGIGD
ncbi:MAG TPA: UGSC family (seleno)protein, partial [Streptosporangiaceae bacterium]|nr:UGSC family (seleno)protein [Streptosporangiaceae bacterium]